MKFNSLSNLEKNVDLVEAAIKGTAKDGTLYMPENIPTLSKEVIDQIGKKDFHDTLVDFLHPYFETHFDAAGLKEILLDAIDFPFKLAEVKKHLFSLELYHGPTLAFKDVGARFMSRVLQKIKPDNKKIIILVATSGDTGSAVANGFYEVEGFEVVLLYPSKKVSKIQEQQFTTLGKNIIALEIEGTFDDCQNMVKKAFCDETLRAKKNISSANSINILRLLPQMTYYIWAYHQLKKPFNICVPSGNFGNLTAGILAKKMGLPINNFIAANNENDVFFRYLKNGKYEPMQTISTLSNAMDVGNPNNFYRLMFLYGDDIKNVVKEVSACKISDKKTLETITKVNDIYNYLLDPHGAVAFAAVEEKVDSFDIPWLFLETAHPAKFKETVEEAIGKPIPLPKSIEDTMEKPKKSILMGSDYEKFKEFLLS